MRRLLPALAMALLTGCSTSGGPCPGSAALETALWSLGGRAWDRLGEDDVVPSWPVPLTRDAGASAFASDGSAVPYRLWLRADREDERGCVCCQALEFGGPPGEAPSLEVVSLHLSAPTWAEAARTAGRLLLAGLPPHVSVTLSLPTQEPAADHLPWEASSPWQSEPDPSGQVLAGSAFLQVDRGTTGWVVSVRHGRSAPGTRAPRYRR